LRELHLNKAEAEWNPEHARDEALRTEIDERTEDATTYLTGWSSAAVFPS
jgi:hypothetical protein